MGKRHQEYKYNYFFKVTKIIDINLMLSIISLNMNGLNTLIKGQINRADTITKCNFFFCKKPTLSIKSDKLKVKGWEKDIPYYH